MTELPIIQVTPRDLWKVRAERLLEQAQDIEREVCDYMGPHADYAREAGADLEDAVSSLSQLVHAFDLEDDIDE